ncbi:tetratricopeptide repeat protein [Streptomyces sp. TS71-3]|uniref:tetratricopeptide repeat protein n=1 Tax=Streptomyces sp. TS71-3 TaxID=2733862 RepID=UPI001BB30046|nr:tetratricopeptide repeat protein [Streptomyces sp. TS71-3]
MPKQGPSRQELNRRRRQDGFIGRGAELGIFRDNLALEPGDEAFQYLFHVRGNAGVGKTSLVRQWESKARKADAVTAYVDDDVHSVLEAMESVSAQFARQGLPMKGFEKLLVTYRQRRHEAEAAPLPATGPADTGSGAAGQPQASAGSTVVAQAGLAGLGMLPGMGAFAGAMDPQKVAQGADRLRALLNARLRSHDDVQLVLSPVRVLTPAFLKDLEEIAERRPWVVLFFDVYERTGPILDEWLHDVLVGEEYGDLPVNVVAVLSGQGRLDSRCWGDHLDLVHDVPLEVFTEEEARRLLASKGITGEQVVDLILHLTGRLPVLVDLLAQAGPQSIDEVGDPTGTAVERFLKWVDDPRRRAAALACALPLQLDEDIHRVVVPDAAEGQYAWLRGLPFVTGQAGRCRYHEFVRVAMLRLQRTQSPERWRDHHGRLAESYARRRRTAQETLEADAYWDDADWREHRLGEMYHRLCADPRGALPAALLDLVNACDEGPATLRRWAGTVAGAGSDTGAAALTDWGHRLQEAADREEDGVAALTVLLTARELDREGRALAHTVRGREHRVAGRYDEAFADYDAALALDPDLARAHYGRGETHRLMDHPEEALVHFDRAIERQPDDGMYLADRGLALQALGRNDEALADFTRAVERDPSYHTALACRGDAYRLLDRYDEALADLTRMIEMYPTFAWVLARRGHTHHAMGHYDEALADLTRALELDPEYAWALSWRGEVNRVTERYEDALADFARALEIDPRYAWVLGQRGVLHRSRERYEEAVADFDRAVELEPRSEWMIAQRGEAYRLMGRHEDAVAEFDRAIGMDTGYAWAIGSRGEARQSLGRYEEALADFDRALEIQPRYAWVLARRAGLHQITGRHEEALADADRAVEINPKSAWVLGRRGEVHRVAGRYDEALADFDRAVEQEPENGWSVGRRGEVHLLSGRFDEARADLDRAVELDAEDDWALAVRGELHQTAGRPADALADLMRSVAIDADDEWCHLHIAVAQRRLGRTEAEAASWARAVEKGTAAAGSGDLARRTNARGNLIVIHCAMSAWAEAARALETFLDGAPDRHRIRAVLDDLAKLRGWLPVDPEPLEPLVRRLEEAGRTAG